MRDIEWQSSNVRNLVFLGEAGCGKSELAVNMASHLANLQKYPVHFFDLDMTKPLFRSRDLGVAFEQMGITLHHQEQFMDAPTTSGGVRRQLKDRESFTVLDVGGDYIGARSIGGYAPLLNQEETILYYVINPYRPWSGTLERIDKVLGETLGVSHLELEKIHLVANPNLGLETTAIDVVEGYHTLCEMVSPYKSPTFLVTTHNLAHEVAEQVDIPCYPISLYLGYPWNGSDLP